MPVFDATALPRFLEPDARAPLDPATNEPAIRAKARLDCPVETLDAQGTGPGPPEGEAR